MTPAQGPEPRLLMAPSALGLLLAAGGYALALWPSLLPRTTVTMAVVGGLGALMGYLLGALLGALVRLVWGRRNPVGQGSGRGGGIGWLVAGLGWLAALVFTPVACGWQSEQLRQLGMKQAPPGWPGVVVGALGVLAVVLMVVRLCRALARKVAYLLTDHGIERLAALSLGGAAAVAVVVGALLLGYVGIQQFYEGVNNESAGQSPPVDSGRSGAPGSLVTWESLGYYGRQFVADPPATEQNGPVPLATAPTTGADDPTRPTQTPIRIYVGIEQGGSVEDRAALAVRELQRAGGFSRSTLVIAIPTGTGLVDPTSVAAAETASDGDIATVALQYSDLPSWLSFLVDKRGSRESATALTSEVLRTWRGLPPDRRPRVFTAGESLGAYGSQGAFPDDAQPADVVSELSGAVWTGPPAQSNLWRSWQADRTGGPAWQPRIGSGAVARVAIDTAGLAPEQQGWGQRRIAIVAHPNDPVVYWSPSLAVSKPAWLEPAPAPTVSSRMRWWPVITMWQCAVDLMAAGNQPTGIGHNYSEEMAAQWRAVLAPSLDSG